MFYVEGMRKASYPLARSLFQFSFLYSFILSNLYSLTLSLKAARYRFVLRGFSKRTSMFNHGQMPVMYSATAARQLGVGWVSASTAPRALSPCFRSIVGL